MTTVLGYGLLAVGLWCLAAAAICWLFARIVRGLSKYPRPAHPPAADAGRVRPAGAARGHHAVTSARRDVPRTSSRLVLVQPSRGVGPADTTSA
ncbi:hypothetical protein ACFWPK_11635, partial [Nocardia sp. NPDC058519]|uniref:hypothetical protein n=1 Tax=Nocardia sp. NPDC058519 TaxID=3346535 RepID=UPI00364E0645